MIYIYGLIDPLTHRIAYVGKTDDLYERWSAHVKTDSRHKAGEWLKRLRASGIEPILVVLEEMDDDADWAIVERWWITHGLRTGWPINNTVHAKNSLISLAWVAGSKTEQYGLDDKDDLWSYLVRSWQSFRWSFERWRSPSVDSCDWSLAKLPEDDTFFFLFAEPALPADTEWAVIE